MVKMPTKSEPPTQVYLGGQDKSPPKCGGRASNSTLASVCSGDEASARVRWCRTAIWWDFTGCRYIAFGFVKLRHDPY